MLERIAQILDDLFGIPHYMVEESDDLVIDWGIDGKEKVRFDSEFCAEFNIPRVPPGTETIADYMDLIDD